MKLTELERRHIVETLKLCQEELEELVRSREWYVTDVLDQIESSLEILGE